MVCIPVKHYAAKDMSLQVIVRSTDENTDRKIIRDTAIGKTKMCAVTHWKFGVRFTDFSIRFASAEDQQNFINAVKHLEIFESDTWIKKIDVG